MQRCLGFSVLGLILLASSACGEDATDDMLLENATYIAALSEGEGESLDQAPEGDLDGGATEDADEATSEEGVVSADCSLGALRRRVVDTYDTDGNGKLSADERGKLAEDFGEHPRRRRRMARHHRLARLVWIYDADESGDLSEEERQALRNDLEMRCENRMAYLLQRFDADGDGALSDEEWVAVRAELAARIRARHSEMLDAYDENGNGIFDVSERRALVMARRSRIQDRRADLKAQYDTDGNGTLDANERAALSEHLKARVRGEHFGRDDRF